MNLRILNIVSGGAALLLTVTCAVAGRYNGAASGEILPQNIFNKMRYTRIISDPQPQPVYFKLTGTMCYDGRSLAFFDGNIGRLRNKVLVPGEEMGGYTITEIASDSIRLQAPGREPVTLRIGAKLAELKANSPKENQ